MNVLAINVTIIITGHLLFTALSRILRLGPLRLYSSFPKFQLMSVLLSTRYYNVDCQIAYNKPQKNVTKHRRGFINCFSQAHILFYVEICNV